jgi:hypothetical protein
MRTSLLFTLAASTALSLPACVAQTDAGDDPNATLTAEDGLTSSPFDATCTGSAVTAAAFEAGKGSQVNMAAIYRFAHNSLQTRARSSSTSPWGARHGATYTLPKRTAPVPVTLTLVLNDDDMQAGFQVIGQQDVFYDHDVVFLGGPTSSSGGHLVASPAPGNVLVPIAENLTFTVGAGCARIYGRSSDGLREWATSWTWTHLPTPQLVSPPFGGGG